MGEAKFLDPDVHPIIGDKPATWLEEQLVEDFKEMRSEYKEFLDKKPAWKKA